MSSSLLLQLGPECLVRLTLIVCMVGGRTTVALWGAASRTCSILLAAFLYCYRQDFFSIYLVSVLLMLPYSSTVARKKLRFILLVRSDFHRTYSLSMAVNAFASHVLMSVSVDETVLPRSVNLSTSFRELPFSVEISPVYLKHICSVLCALTWSPMPAAARSRLHSWVSAWASAFTRSAMSSV